MRRTEFLTEKRPFTELEAGLIMERDVVTCGLSDSGRFISTKLTENNFGSLPVVDDDGFLVGLVSEFDLLKPLLAEARLEDLTAESLMTRDVRFIREKTPVGEVIRLLDEEHLIRVPVVENDKLVGIVARRDILFAYIKATAKYWP